MLVFSLLTKQVGSILTEEVDLSDYVGRAEPA